MFKAIASGAIAGVVYLFMKNICPECNSWILIIAALSVGSILFGIIGALTN